MVLLKVEKESRKKKVIEYRSCSIVVEWENGKNEPLASFSFIAMAAHLLSEFSYYSPPFVLPPGTALGLYGLCMSTLVLTYINKWADVVQVFFLFDFFVCFFIATSTTIFH